jgi:hypothetical protein
MTFLYELHVNATKSECLLIMLFQTAVVALVKMRVYYKQENVKFVLTCSNVLVFTCFKGLRKTLLKTNDLSARNPTQYHLHVQSANNTFVNFSCFKVKETVKAG